MNELLLNRFEKWQRTAWIVGIIGCILWLIGIVIARHTAFQSYWFAWIFWNGIGFGALSILMMHILSGGAWGSIVRPTVRAAIFTIPMMALLMIPIFFSMGDVFPWATLHGLDESTPHKRAYLSVPWFIVRAVIYFAILITLVRILRVHAEVGDDRTARLASGAGICIYGICMLFACTDWIMSLVPRWYTTMLVVITMAWQFLAALAFCVIIVTALARAGLPVTTKQLHDLGNLLLAFVIFWIYVSFGQFLIIWSGNLPREISWYLPRSGGGWQYTAVALALLQFLIPFFLLLSRARKQQARRLLPVAVMIFSTNIIEVFWLIVPSLRPTGFHVAWLDVAAFIGLGGLWVGAFLGFSKQQLASALPAATEATHG
jgi:hypothetical protein